MILKNINNIRKDLYDRVLHSKIWGEDFIVQHKEEKNLLISALDSHIPKKQTLDRRCPICGYPIYNQSYRFCPCCGQRIIGEW